MTSLPRPWWTRVPYTIVFVDKVKKLKLHASKEGQGLMGVNFATKPL